MYEVTSQIVEVNVLPQESSIQVGYDRQGIADGQQVWRKIHYELYSADKRDQFITDIENPYNGGNPGMAAPYIAAVGW